ncbi:hypothetical protein [Saccharopolyspora pogona]|uniref:hypothetical protein n=1 Tax=Saccharopolyspora pogona TaxID=333966 RepID=UPI00168458DE|nr:hypothetical protein [Saccharopolyspora pogona]
MEAPVSREAVQERLAELGVHVVDSGSVRPDVVLAGEVVFSVRSPDLEEQKLGLPFIPEPEL